MKRLLLKLLRIGIIGFGGGSALIPVIEYEVKQLKQSDGSLLVTEQEYDKAVVLASVTPGALPVEISGLLGSNIAGSLGMVAGASAMALPGAIFTILLLGIVSLASSAAERQILYVEIGVAAFICCLIINYITEVVKNFVHEKKTGLIMTIIGIIFLLTAGKNLYRLFQLDGKPLIVLSLLDMLLFAFIVIVISAGASFKGHRVITLLFCSSFLLCAFLKNSVPNIMLWARLLAAVVIVGGLTMSLRHEHMELPAINSHDRQRMFREILACIGFSLLLALPVLFANVSLGSDFVINSWVSSLLSFGGGDAYLTVADGLFVAGGMISEELFYGTLVPIINVLPGSILCKTLTGLGYLIAMDATESLYCALGTALAGFGASVAASCTTVSLMRFIYDKYENLKIFIIIRRWIRPIISGLLLTVICSLLSQNLKAGLEAQTGYEYLYLTLIIFAIDMLLFYSFRIKSIWLVIISVLLSSSSCNFLYG